MNDKWRNETIALATLVGEEAERPMNTIEDLMEWVRSENERELVEFLAR